MKPPRRRSSSAPRAAAAATRARPGKAANLHETKLDRAQLIELISCGQPGSEMPHFGKYAYEDTKCYGLSVEQVGANKPPVPPSDSLTQREIAAVVDYIPATFVGK